MNVENNNTPQDNKNPMLLALDEDIAKALVDIGELTMKIEEKIDNLDGLERDMAKENPEKEKEGESFGFSGKLDTRYQDLLSHKQGLKSLLNRLNDLV